MTIKGTSGDGKRASKQPAPPLPLWTIDELAEHTKLKRRWLYNNIYLVPHIEIAGQLRFRPDAIDAWLDEQTRGVA